MSRTKAECPAAVSGAAKVSSGVTRAGQAKVAVGQEGQCSTASEIDAQYEGC